jgi:hypothetical protein
MGCSCRYHRGGPVRCISLQLMTNTPLTNQQGRFGSQAGSSQSMSSPKRLQLSNQLHLVTHTATDMSIRCCSEPFQTTEGTDHNLSAS